MFVRPTLKSIMPNTTYFCNASASFLNLLNSILINTMISFSKQSSLEHRRCPGNYETNKIYKKIRKKSDKSW